MAYTVANPVWASAKGTEVLYNAVNFHAYLKRTGIIEGCDAEEGAVVPKRRLQQAEVEKAVTELVDLCTLPADALDGAGDGGGNNEAVNPLTNTLKKEDEYVNPLTNTVPNNANLCMNPAGGEELPTSTPTKVDEEGEKQLPEGGREELPLSTQQMEEQRMEELLEQDSLLL